MIRDKMFPDRYLLPVTAFDFSSLCCSLSRWLSLGNRCDDNNYNEGRMKNDFNRDETAKIICQRANTHYMYSALQSNYLRIYMYDLLLYFCSAYLDVEALTV